MGKKVVILDSSAFIVGFDPTSIQWESYTVPAVEDELRPESISKARFRAAVESGEVKVLAPSPEFLREAREFSRAVGDSESVSQVDLQLVALALELRSMGYQPIIATDDYAIQNVADQAGVDYASLATLGITHRLYWVLYCPACHRRYPPDCKLRFCRVCGAELRRRPSRRVPARGAAE